MQSAHQLQDLFPKQPLVQTPHGLAHKGAKPDPAPWGEKST